MSENERHTKDREDLWTALDEHNAARILTTRPGAQGYVRAVYAINTRIARGLDACALLLAEPCGSPTCDGNCGTPAPSPAVLYTMASGMTTILAQGGPDELVALLDNYIQLRGRIGNAKRKAVRRGARKAKTKSHGVRKRKAPRPKTARAARKTLVANARKVVRR